MVKQRERALDGKGRRGFTLVELLVVVAIIALLVAILMPTLGQARSQAQRAACQGNFKGLATGYATYASEFDNYVPTGNRNNAVTDDYRVGVNSNPYRWYAMGWLYNNGYINNSKALFCPVQKNTFFTLQYSGQSWTSPGSTPVGNMWAGYANYYAPDWNGTNPPAPNGGCANGGTLPWVKVAGRVLYKVDDLMPAMHSNGAYVGPGAVLSEVLNDYTFMDMTHINGANFMFADWSVSWLPRNTIGPSGLSLNYYTNPVVFPGGNTTVSATNKQAILDMASQMK